MTDDRPHTRPTMTNALYLMAAVSGFILGAIYIGSKALAICGR